MKKKKRKGKKVFLHVFSHQKWKRKKVKNCQIRTCGFHCIAKHKEGSLKLCALFVVCSQIWLNLRRDDCHFLYIFQAPMNDRHSSYKQKCPKKEKTLVWFSCSLRYCRSVWSAHACSVLGAVCPITNLKPVSCHAPYFADFFSRRDVSPCRAMAHTLLTFSAVVMSARVVPCPILCGLFLPSWCKPVSCHAPYFIWCLYLLSSSIQADRHLW
jgi:hypothetical protein